MINFNSDKNSLTNDSDKRGFIKLDNKGDNYIITRKRAFQSNVTLSEENFYKAFDFSYNMSFGQSGAHRNYRSGGTYRRKKGEIFADAFQGKLAEFTIYEYYKSQKVFVEEPNLSVKGRGEWDPYDLKINDKVINIKSTKYFGNLMLLEKKDWNKDARYIPNIGKVNEVKYDFFVLVRIKPDISLILKKHSILDLNECEYEILESLFNYENFEYNIVGFITNEDFKSLISNEQYIPRGGLLNSKLPMDADNYYIQSDDMIEIENLINLL
jgi:hypothetical protein